jgi:hypothetical protein
VRHFPGFIGKTAAWARNPGTAGARRIGTCGIAQRISA